VESYEILGEIVENASEGIIITDSNSIITSANSVARMIFAVTQEQIIGWKIADIFRENEHLLSIYYKYVSK